MTRTFPNTRLRRLRQAPWIRSLVQEHRILPQDLVLPLFVTTDPTGPITMMPGVERHNLSDLVKVAEEAHALGIPAVALFPVIPASLKSDHGQEAYRQGNLMSQAITLLKTTVPDLGIIADVALDPYTTHGHDGIVIHDRVCNDSTLEALSKQALMLAEAGADVIAPSDMQDGRIGVIRQALEQKGFKDTMILSYAVKYASAFYGPFRDAIGSSQSLKGDKKTYQMACSQALEGVHEAILDAHEGADMLMVKPGMPYLDVLHRVKEALKMPTLAYQVSGEYTMLKTLAHTTGQPWLPLMLESLIAMKRAGADGILTYAAIEVAQAIEPQS